MAKAAVSKMRQVRVGERRGDESGRGDGSGIPNSNEGIMSLVLTIFG